MPTELLYTLLATIIISSGSLVGVLTIALKPKYLHKITLPLVSLSAGTMLSAGFLHLLPESIESLGAELPFQLTLSSFVGFFVLERFLHWRHCHDEDHLTKHTLGVMNLLADSLHNFLDGLLIAASFASGSTLGFVATLAIALHEIPQELGDFGVLLHSGFSRKLALIWNLLVSLTAIIGGFVGYYAAVSVSAFAPYLIPIAAGGFIYIAASDLVPELKNAKSTKKTLATVITFLLGIVIMILVKE